MFLGEYRLSLNDDRSLVIPKPFNELFPDGAYITRGFEQNLLIMSTRTFEAIYARVSGSNIADPVARLLRRLMLGNACKLEADQAGNVPVPQALLSFASLEKEIVLVGQGDYFEIWAPDLWKEQEVIVNDAETNAQRFAALDLKTR